MGSILLCCPVRCKALPTFAIHFTKMGLPKSTIKQAVNVFKSEVETLRCIVSVYRLEKTRRAVYRLTAVALAGVTGTNRTRRKPPALDVRTGWTLTRRMLLESLDDKQIVNAATKYEKIASRFAGLELSGVNWINFRFICGFLDKPESIARNPGSEP
jgi:hypothetical protein